MYEIFYSTLPPNMDPKTINIAEYSYVLPEEKIAIHPLKERDQSKLLLYSKGSITNHHFYDLPELLSKDQLLVFNNTRVIHARLIFQRPTGSRIEIMCLEPITPNEPALAFGQTGSCVWLALIGNNKKWKEEFLQMELPDLGSTLTVKRLEPKDDAFLVAFTWTNNVDFATVIDYAGKLPLPPYLNRDADDSDEERYQTVYALHNGSVAAPTAGLHFTENVLNNLSNKNIKSAFVTLHVGAGTFKPVKTQQMSDHIMHEERIYVERSFIKQLTEHNNIIAVGTTSLRTLETLYWFGLNLLTNNGKVEINNDLLVSQWEPYGYDVEQIKSADEVFEYLHDWMLNNKIEILSGFTQIIIAPPYKLKVAKAIITNFHQPESTLLLLIASVVGEDWKHIYTHALENNYRFLSYGDSSLLYAN